MGPLWYTDAVILSGPLTNADSGHQGRPTRATFDTAAARQIYQYASQMIEGGLAAPITNDPQGDLKAIGRGELAMTIHPISDLKSVATALAQGQAPGVSLRVAAVPTAAGPGGILVRSNSLFLSKESTPTARAGTWSFVSWLEAPAQQARGLVSAKSFYFPDRRSAAADSTFAAALASQPVLAQAWGVLANGPSTPIPAIGVHGPVMVALDSVLKAITTHTASLDDALAQATRTVDSELAAYNADPHRYAQAGSLPLSGKTLGFVRTPV